MPAGSHVIIHKSVNHNFVFNIIQKCIQCLIKNRINHLNEIENSSFFSHFTQFTVFNGCNGHQYGAIKMRFSNDNNYFLGYIFAITLRRCVLT